MNRFEVLLVNNEEVDNDKSKLDNNKVDTNKAQNPVDATCPPETAKSSRNLYSCASMFDLEGQGCALRQ